MKAKRTTSPVRTAASPGASATRVTVLGTTVIVQRSVAVPLETLTVAWPGERALRRPKGFTSTTVGRVDFHATGS